jgi:parvulin-like peptidyl-prolyl isomerase
MERHAEEEDTIKGKTGFHRVRIVVPLFFLLLGGPTGRGFADGGGPGKTDREGARSPIAARVNGAEIPVKSVTMTTNRMSAGMGRAHSAPEVAEEMRKRALNLLILQELAWQKADGKVERERVDRKIASLKAKSGGEEGYGKFLEQEGLSGSEATVMVEKGIVLDRTLEKEVLSRIAVSEEDLRKEYEREKDRYHTPEKVEVVDVVFFLETGERDSMKKAEEVRGRIKDEMGNNPLRLAPDGTFIVREIEIPKEKEGVLYEEAKKLKVDELSGVITTPDSLHVIQLKKITPEKQFSFEQVKGSIEGTLKKEALQKRMQEWESEMKRGATIEIVER